MPCKIGFADYNLEIFHANVYLLAFREELSTRGYDAVYNSFNENKMIIGYV